MLLIRIIPSIISSIPPTMNTHETVPLWLNNKQIASKISKHGGAYIEIVSKVLNPLTFRSITFFN